LDAENHCDRHARCAHLAVFAHDDVGVGGGEADQAEARSGHLGGGMRRVGEAGLRIAHDVHCGDGGRGIAFLVQRHRQCGDVDLVAEPDDFLHRAGGDVIERARRLAQAPGQGGEIVFAGDAERTALRPAMLHQDVAQAEAGAFDDVFEHDRAFALR
jgi:hypothetical protein